MPKISIIIPCYNQGEYIDEAVDSVLHQTFQDFEIIIVNDGSTNEFTKNKLKNYTKPKCKVIHTDNQGLPSARNNGILVSSGSYILPLDADDKIGPKYLEEATKILDKNHEIGIVYCNAEYFEARRGRWILPEYSLERMLIMNVIFCSSFFRKEDFLSVGGYECDMKYGWEDWDLWLRFIEKGKEVYKLPDVHFFYRIKEDKSMISDLVFDSEKKNYSLKKIYMNHVDLYINNLGHPMELFSKLNAALTSPEFKIGSLIVTPYRKLKREVKNLF
jgi:glycosyltransferase involved in cell wall biosynthesis